MNAAAETRSATSRGGHGGAPLTPEGRLRLCLRADAGRPVAHVAAQAGLSRRCLRWRPGACRSHRRDGGFGGGGGRSGRAVHCRRRIPGGTCPGLSGLAGR
ncbi:hypothetical protein E6R18_31910 [Streptomyces sp. A1277]|nr:hypothetical protein E6R18_31910 [Streptomyces sp. A1277]